jgi:hypothetical protein
MRDFKHLVYDVLPCWYELSWNNSKKRPAIIIRVHKDFIKATKEIPADAPIILELQKQFNLGDFCRNLNEGFGFEGAFRKISENDEFVVWLVTLPKIRKNEKIMCGSCAGSGKGFMEGEKCFSCNGKGREHVIDWHDAFAVSASFTVFSVLTIHTDIETISKMPQLLSVETTTQEGMHGGSLWGIYSIPLVAWLGSHQGQSIDEMTIAMMSAYKYMWELELFNRPYFWTRVESSNGWLNVSCPGNACGLNPDSSSDLRPGRGYKFSCHNTDSPLQQITLLAGLAALHDQARKEIK